METERKKFGVEMSPRLHKRLKEEALKRDEPLWAITQEAIERYLNDEKAPPEDEAITNLRAYLAIAARYPAERPFAEALRTNILIFWREAKRRLNRAG